MHDIDRALFEAEAELGPSQIGEYEFGRHEFGESEAGEFGEYEAGEYEFGESEAGEFGEYEFGEGGATDREVGLANELLGVSGEQELDRFLGDLVNGAVSAVRQFARTDAGRAVGGVLKSAARNVLPQLGRMAGDAVGPGAGAVGQRVGRWAANRLEVAPQTEGLSAEDREYETARAFVRFAQETAQRAAQAGTAVPAIVAARQAARDAARTHLPGLLRPGDGPRFAAPAAQGRWVRHGNRIVILGL